MPGGQRVRAAALPPGGRPGGPGDEYAVLDHLMAAGWIVSIRVSEPVRHDGAAGPPNPYVPGRPAVRRQPHPAAQGGAAQPRPGSTWPCATSASGSGSARAGVPSTTPSPPTPASTGPGACGRPAARLQPEARPPRRRPRPCGRAAALAAIGAAELPVTVIHGDFAEQNVHYRHGLVAGVAIDFAVYSPGLTALRAGHRAHLARPWRPLRPATAANWPAAAGPSARWKKRPSSPSTARVPPRHGCLGTRSRPQDRPVQPDRNRTPAIQDRHPATMTRSGPTGTGKLS